MSSHNGREGCGRFLSVSLAALLVLQTSLSAQKEEILAPALKIAVAKGDESTNNIKKGTAVEPLVVVSDEKSRPVSGVMVMFTLPESGPGGLFANGGSRTIVFTDEEGRAAARGLRPNHTPGKFELVVDASFHGLTARTVIHQTNVLPAASGVSPKLIAILAVVGGAAAAGAIAASSGNKGSSTTTNPSTSSTTLTAGTPTFGPPR
ncbi:MAG TPA: hypothetical protein VMW38_06315 [Terriglobia bacterium]|nr:hypothetical protein [Terriglobia bacterium]